MKTTRNKKDKSLYTHVEILKTDNERLEAIREKHGYASRTLIITKLIDRLGDKKL
jgi:hypothetical protein